MEEENAEINEHHEEEPKNEEENVQQEQNQENINENEENKEIEPNIEQKEETQQQKEGSGEAAGDIQNESQKEEIKENNDQAEQNQPEEVKNEEQVENEENKEVNEENNEINEESQKDNNVEETKNQDNNEVDQQNEINQELENNKEKEQGNNEEQKEIEGNNEELPENEKEPENKEEEKKEEIENNQEEIKNNEDNIEENKKEESKNVSSENVNESQCNNKLNEEVNDNNQEEQKDPEKLSQNQEGNNNSSDQNGGSTPVKEEQVNTEQEIIREPFSSDRNGEDLSSSNEQHEDEEESTNRQQNGLQNNTMGQKSSSSGYDYTKSKQATFENVKLLYKNKLNILRQAPCLDDIYVKFWKLLPHTFEGDITKASFMKLFTKIYKVILPIFSYRQIDTFVEGQWILFNKERITMTKKVFKKCLFQIPHLWCVHINKFEYEDFLLMLYGRITKIKKIFNDGKEKKYIPSIKVQIYSPIPKEEYENFTWEYFDNPNNIHLNLYEIDDQGQGGDQIMGAEGDDNANQNENNQEEINNNNGNPETIKARPLLLDGENSRYSSPNNFLLYNEETFYLENDEINDLKLNEYIVYELLEDDELVIFGYPTQFIINKFINEPNVLEDILVEETNDYDSFFFITDFKTYEKHKIFLKIAGKEVLQRFLSNNSSFTLLRDIYLIHQGSYLGSDFSEDELNVINNLRRNICFDRYIDMYEIKLQNGSKIKVNLENLIINPTYKKAFENIFKSKTTIGTKSHLWSETIEEKIEKIYYTKFYLVHTKLLNLNLSYEAYEQNIEAIKEEIASKKAQLLKDEEQDLEFFEKFKSKMGIKVDNWDSDNDLYDEANKKSPVVLVVGPPLIGKTSVSQKLSKDLEMVYLEPTKFFESIFAKVAEFEEKMANWDENEGQEEVNNEAEGEEGENKDKEKEVPKKQKPGVDTVLNKVEYDIYCDLTRGQGISELNMQRMYMYLLHSDLAFSRGVVIDMNSNIYPKTDDPNNDTRCFVEKILTGYYGNVEVDYVVDLTIDKEDLEERKQKMKFNLKTLKTISPREIELMKKPKIVQKEILEDEIEYDEEGKPIVPEPEPEQELTEEELEKIPKPEDLLEITDFDRIFEEQYEYYYNTQYPKVLEYVNTLKKNYYIKVDVSGLDFDEVSNLIKAKLDFANPPRPIAKIIEGGDYKSLLMDGREGVLPFRKWSPWKQIDPVALKDDFLLLTGSTEFPASYFSRVFLFVSEENRKKFLENPKKYISAPPQVPVNYRISIIGPPKSGKSTIAQMLSELYGWKVIDMEEIYEKVKEYQKTWEEPELNSVYTRKVHFSASEFKDVLANMAKKPADRKPENFVSKIVFMLDALGIPLDKKKTKEEFFAERKYHQDKLAHLFNRMKEEKERAEQDELDEKTRLEEEEQEKQRLEQEEKEEVELFKDMTECARSQYEIEKDKRAQAYADHVQQKLDEKNQKLKALAEKEAQNPFPPEEDYNIEDLKSDQFFLAFDNEGNQPRVNGIILMNHPFSEDECNKLKDFNILMDRVIYINDPSDEGMKAYVTRRNPNFEGMDEEKQNNEMEKIKTELTKYEELIGIVKEKYNTNNEECVIEVGYNEPLEVLKRKLINAINPFSIRVDTEDKVVQPSDIPADDKFPLSRGPYGVFCPVTYKEDNWLFYAPEANEMQVNQRIYRLAGEKEMEKFRANPEIYLGEQGNMFPIDVPPPHIMFTGYQGSGVTFFTNILCKEYKMTKRELQKEFMEIWDRQRLERKEIRINKKKEEIAKQNEEIEQKNKENPEQEPEPLVDVEEAIANDQGLDEEDENYNAVENDKEIFKSLFLPLSPTIYDATWNGMEEKVSTPIADLMNETRRVPNVMVVFKVSQKSIMDRLFHMEEIEGQYEAMLKASNEKRKQREEELIKQKQQEIYEQLKEQMENEQQEEEENKGAEPEEEKEKEEGEGEGEEGEKKENEEEGEEEEKPKEKKEKKLPDVNTIKVELEPEEKDDIWNSPDPDLIEKDALIQQEKDKLMQRYENNVATIQTLIDTLKERGIPVIEIVNDTNKENVYKNLLVELSPYINNRRNLIEKQLVFNKEFPQPLLLRKVKDLYTNSDVYQQSVYNLLSPVNPHKLCIRTDYPLVYRDRVYLFNKEEEKKDFIEYPLDYRTGLECPKDSYPMRGRSIIFTIGQMCSGKTTLAKLMSEYMGYKRVTVRKACLDLIQKIHDCTLRKQIEDVLFGGSATDDNLIIKIINRRVTMEDLVNENIVIDGFPYTLSQANLLGEELIPNYVFVSECDLNTNIQRALKLDMFKGLPEVVNERMKELGSHLADILNIFKEKEYDIRYFDMSKSKWALKDMIHDLLENCMKYEMKFARNLTLEKPCQLTAFTPQKLLHSIIYQQHEKGELYSYSPLALKTQNTFVYNKYRNDSSNNNIVYTPKSEINFHFLTSEEEVKQFSSHVEDYDTYLTKISTDVRPPKYLKPERVAEVIYRDDFEIVDESNSESEGEKDSVDELNDREQNAKLSLNIKFEYQDCCPVTIVEDKLMQNGKLAYSVRYCGKYYKFLSMEKLRKFKINPKKYVKLKLPVKKVNEEENLLAEKQISFTNTVNFLEFTFGSLITKGMLELSNNRIKYPYLNVKESTLKYLALFLKANNPNNNAYAKKKYGEILKEFVNNSKLPFELYKVFENYHQVKDNPLRKQLIRKQLDTVSSKYDELMEKAKIQNNTRFENFFRRPIDNNQNSLG